MYRRLKDFRRIATRYDNCVDTILSATLVAPSLQGSSFRSRPQKLTHLRNYSVILLQHFRHSSAAGDNMGVVLRGVIFLAAASISVGISFWISPDRLSAIGLMDASLAHSNSLVRETTLFEVQAAKYGFLGLAVLLLILWQVMPRIVNSAWYNRIPEEKRRFPKAYEAHQAQLYTVTAYVAWGALVLAVLFLMFGRLTLPPEWLIEIGREDGILETTSVLLLLAASVLALRVALRAGWSAIGAMHAFLAFLFFVMFGEEISWGQRILNIETPEALRELNVQQEINLHNMMGYFFDHLFILCFFIWGCIVPILYWSSASWRWCQSRIGLPFPSMGLAIAMLLVTLMQDQLTDVFLGRVPHLRVPELREFLSAICFMLLMLESRHLVPFTPMEALRGNEVPSE